MRWTKNFVIGSGRFGVRIADLAQADGYKVALFAWSSGEPERAGWEEPAMLDYLRLCADRPDQAAVALHEYSYELHDLFADFPNRLGRFQILFDVCDQHSIPRPTTFFTEWGWTLNEVPVPEVALPAIEVAGELYSLYPEIRGGAIWYLGAGWSGLADKAQALIAPVADLTRNTLFTGPPLSGQAPVEPGDGGDKDAREKPEDPPAPEPAIAPDLEKPAMSFVADVTIPDDSRLAAGEKFIKTWRVRNIGALPWGPDYGLRFSGGEPMSERLRIDIPVTQPGDEVELTLELTAPPGPGVYTSSWGLVDPAGQPFGDKLFTRIISIEPVANAEFVADVTFPDDSEVSTGSLFAKTWRVRNNGTIRWGPGFTLHFIKGTPMSAQRWVDLPAVEPDEEINITLELRAPFTRGTHFCDWRLRDENGNFFGDTLFARIKAV